MSKYKDKFGDLWIRIDSSTVRRPRDNNLGGWFEGKGLWKQI